jgi:hypothetical protein
VVYDCNVRPLIEVRNIVLIRENVYDHEKNEVDDAQLDRFLLDRYFEDEGLDNTDFDVQKDAMREYTDTETFKDEENASHTMDGGDDESASNSSSDTEATQEVYVSISAVDDKQDIPVPPKIVIEDSVFHDIQNELSPDKTKVVSIASTCLDVGQLYL